MRIKTSIRELNDAGFYLDNPAVFELDCPVQRRLFETETADAGKVEVRLEYRHYCRAIPLLVIRPARAIRRQRSSVYATYVLPVAVLLTWFAAAVGTIVGVVCGFAAIGVATFVIARGYLLEPRDHLDGALRTAGWQLRRISAMQTAYAQEVERQRRDSA